MSIPLHISPFLRLILQLSATWSQELNINKCVQEQLRPAIPWHIIVFIAHISLFIYSFCILVITQLILYYIILSNSFKLFRAYVIFISVFSSTLGGMHTRFLNGNCDALMFLFSHALFIPGSTSFNAERMYVCCLQFFWTAVSCVLWRVSVILCHFKSSNRKFH